MNFKLTIDCGNDAFGANDADRHFEVARILRDLANKIEDGYLLVYLADNNGNTVGTARFQNQSEE